MSCFDIFGTAADAASSGADAGAAAGDAASAASDVGTAASDAATAAQAPADAALFGPAAVFGPAGAGAGMSPGEEALFGPTSAFDSTMAADSAATGAAAPTAVTDAASSPANAGMSQILQSGTSDPGAAENAAISGGSNPVAASAAGAAQKGISTTGAALGALALLGAAMSKPSAKQQQATLPGPSSTAATQGPLFNAPLNPSAFVNRTPVNPGINTQTQGGGPERLYFQNNQLHFRRGGALQQANQPIEPSRGEHYVEGGSPGQADDRRALLSDGEYVLTAADVSALGDGNNKAGALRLDAMRQRLHHDLGHRSVIQPKAKAPEHYL